MASATDILDSCDHISEREQFVVLHGGGHKYVAIVCVACATKAIEVAVAQALNKAAADLEADAATTSPDSAASRTTREFARVWAEEFRARRSA